MECTQRLECTQELYETHTERVCPEQIGFLGICGAKHPVLRGPNKIGRDPSTCSIVLNLNSVSRQHAVINVLSSKEFMLMDLDSANKTKLLNKTLQPYIPHPIRNGDTVQFGDIFGIFRLLEEDDELPMTQALDIPETPVPSKHVSKLVKTTTTLIPESPDVSDKEDSFATPQQSKSETTRLSSGQFIKPFGKSIPIHPISTPQNETNRNSSKKMISFVDNANTSLNESLISLKVDKNADNIHEMDTQAPYPIVKPSANDSTDSIYMADTQIPTVHGISPSIHSLDTQIPTTEHLPQIRKIDNQQDMQFDLYAANKENDLSIFNAETQPFVSEKDKSIEASPNSPVIPPKALNKSEEELLFDEVDDECLEDFNSQPLLPQESPKQEKKPQEPFKKPAIIESDSSTDCEDIDIVPTQKVEELPVKQQPVKVVDKAPPALKRTNRLQSDDSTDCEDIEFMPTQKIQELSVVNDTVKENKVDKKIAAKRDNRIQSDGSTDCEDVHILPKQKIPTKNVNKDEDLTDCEDDIEIVLPQKSKDVAVSIFDDMPTQVIDIDPNKIEKPAFEDMNTQIIDLDENIAATSKKDTSFQNQPTQIIDEIQLTQVIAIDPNKIVKPALEDMNTQIIDVDENTTAPSKRDSSFEDQPTQIIDEIIPNKPETAKKSFDSMVSPFKIPVQSPIRIKSKELLKATPKAKIPETVAIDDVNYYNATQDILDDLCSQREGSPILVNDTAKSRDTNKSPIIIDDDVVPCSVEGYTVGEKFANIDRDLSPSKPCKDLNAEKYAANLTSQEVRDVIVIDGSVDKLKKFPSDSSSDIECTPKKVRTFLFTDSDLPNSQEIKSSMLTNHTKSYATESSSESESEMNNEDQNTPFLHRKKKSIPVAKIDLTKKFDVEKLPDRIITRVRKPTAKMEENMQFDKKANRNILKPNFLTEQEDQIDQDIITENMKRLKTYEKAKASKEAKNENKTKADKNEPMGDKNEDKPNVERVNNSDNPTKNVEKNTKESKETENKNETTTRTKPENKSKDAKVKIRVKIEKPKKKVTGKDSKSKDKEKGSTRMSKEEITTRRSKERTSANIKEDPGRKSETDKNKSKEESLLSTSDGKISTRSTRAKRKVNETKTAEKKSESPENISKEPVENKRKRPTRRKEQPKEPSPEVEIRRSKRQVKVKEDDKTDCQIVQAPKSILKKSIHEQSTVYNVSTSSAETSKTSKRSLDEDSEVPSSKRTRGAVNNVNSSSISINNASLRATPARTMKTQHVLFTAFPNEEVRQKLEKLGAVIVTDVVQCTVVLTMQIKRTFKLLCAVGLGRPIVGPSWVQACVDTHMIVDPWLYLIKDEPAEKRFVFNLDRTLTSKRNFLKGYNVSSTPSVQPNATEMKLIVECSGGTWKEGGSNWVCVSSTKDQALWPALRKRGATIVSTEFILGGVLRQKIEITGNKFP